MFKNFKETICLTALLGVLIPATFVLLETIVDHPPAVVVTVLSLTAFILLYKTEEEDDG